MAAQIAHRGLVDDPLVLPAPHTAFYIRRLPIEDEARGQQPKCSFDNKIVVAMNGEIYNHKVLREELEALGIPFQSDCDTEVLANALRAWGVKALPKLDGIFAFVAFDLGSREVLAARDPFGVKPLYVVQRESSFLFCSEVTPLLSITETDNVLLLPPGYLLTRDICARYYTLPHATAKTAFSPSDLDRILEQAVISRLPSHQPVAALFSGGIDSTLLVHYARNQIRSLPAYFVGNQFGKDYGYAREYADRTGLDLRFVEMQPWDKSTLPDLASTVQILETYEPTAVRAAMQTQLASLHIHNDGFRVALCGEGADELFAGYVPLEHAFERSEALGRDAQTQCLSLMHRVNLQRIDRCGMQHQVEIREPFLDLSLTKYALGLPSAALIETVNNYPRGKQPLRQLYDLHPDALPRSIRERSKLGFGDDLADQSQALIDSLFDEEVTDLEFQDGKRRFSAFTLFNKEEYFYLSRLAEKMDINRLPHLRERALLSLPPDLQSTLATHVTG